MSTFGIPPALADAVESLKESIDAGRTDIFRKLLEACETCEGGGIEEREQLVNSLSTEDGTFLHMATKLGHSDIIRAILAAGADPGIIDRTGNTPIQVCPSSIISSVYVEELLRATAKSEIGRVCQLIASGVNVNAHDNSLSRNTSLHWAASFADLDTVNCLIARGADVNSCNNEGKTALHDAVVRGDSSVVETLLIHGSNPHIQCYRGNHKGQTPFEMAQSKSEILKLFDPCSIHPKTNGMPHPGTNGSISPVIHKNSLAERAVSIESLNSIGEDSVLTTSIDVDNFKEKTIKSQILNSVPEEVNGVSKKNTRSPLESTSSLEMTPIMEQVCERLAAVQMTTRPRPLIINSAFHNLWPQPKRLTELSGPQWKVPSVITLAVAYGPAPFHQIVDVWSIHKPWFSALGRDIRLGCMIGARNFNKGCDTVQCVVNPALVVSPNYYSIVVEEKGVCMICGSLSALHHALVTFCQLLRVFASEMGGKSEDDDLSIPQLSLVDYPSIPNRGFILDMSPMTRIPTIERVYQIVDTLLSLKMNQLHLLFKISYHHRNSNSVLQDMKEKCCCIIPFSSSELVALERYCGDRGIVLVPGIDVERTESVHFSLSDLSVAVSEAISNLPTAKFVHIGPGLTSVLADLTAPSHSSWAQLQIPDCAVLMVCANVFHNNPGALEKLPLSSILVEYGFQADYDFSTGCQLALEKGRSLAVCPGTSAWSSLSGWPEAGVSNVYSGVVSSLENGANCILVANWSNTACFTPLAFAWPPLLVAAGLSWNHTTHWDFVHSSVGCLIDQHLFQVPNCGLGDALIELGRCETWLTRVARDQASNDPNDLPSCHGSTLHQFLVDPDGVNVDHLNVEVFANVMRHVRKVIRDSLHRRDERDVAKISSSPWPLASLSVLELNLTMDMMFTACRIGRALVTMGTNPRSNMGFAVMNPGVANLPPTMRTDLANKVLALREVYSSVWLQGHTSNGLQSSLLIFSSLLSRLLPEQTIHGI